MAAMHVLTQSSAETVMSGIRPFDIGRDLRAVARLIADAFADDLDDRGEAALRELRILGHMSGLVRVLSRSTGEFQDVLSGFVWVENGEVVGNVTVQRALNGGERWQIANVAVAPAWRGRGISRALMEQALHYIHEMGGVWAVLQVRAENRIARGLYERLKFENMGGIVELHTPQVPVVSRQPAIPGLQDFSASDTNLLYELATSQPNAESQWWRSLRRIDFQISLEQRLGEWLSRLVGRERVYRMAVRDFQNRFEGAIILTARRWQGTHRIQLWTRPETRERYEHRLVLWALAMLQEYPKWPVRTTISTANEQALATLLENGFHIQNTLYTMRRRV